MKMKNAIRNYIVNNVNRYRKMKDWARIGMFFLPDYYFLLPFRVVVVGMLFSFEQAEQYHFSGVGSLRPTHAR